MIQKKFSVEKWIFWILVSVFLLILAVTGYGEKRQRVELDDINVSTEGWSYQTVEEHHTLQAAHEITAEMEGKTVAFYVNDSYVDAKIGSQLIYHFGEKPLFGKSPGSYYHFIEIPENVKGQKLSITIQTVYPHKYSDICEFRIGSKGDIIFSYLHKEIFNIITNFAILVFGIIMCLFHFFEARMKIQRGKNLYFGLLSIIFVCWSNCALFVNQMLFENAILQYYLNYFSLFLLLLVFILYIESLDESMHCRPEFWIGMVSVLMFMILHFGNIMDFTETLRIFSVIAGLDMVLLIIRIGTYVRKKRTAMIALLILIGFGLLNIIDYMIQSKNVGRYTLLSKMGLVIYMFVSVYVGIQHIFHETLLAEESVLLKKIAYVDNLTKRNNRYALQRDLQDMDLSSLSIVSLDLNNLKICNDRFGHAEGDRFIREAADILNEIYPNIYRVGGDEFVALLESASEENLAEKKKRMQEKVAEYNAKRDTNAVLEIASGCSSYREGDASYEDILKRADKEMYLDKRRLKETVNLQMN